MDQKTGKSEKVSVPLYAKIGLGVTWLLMLSLAAMILRNCATSVIYGLQTDRQTADSYYQEGVHDGSLGQGQNLRGQAEENSVLRKAYIKGYRDGIDRGQKQKKPLE